MKQPEQAIIILVVLVLAATLLPAPVLATETGTTEVHIVKYANDEETILNETTIDYRWLEANLPVQGDGVTRYYTRARSLKGSGRRSTPTSPTTPGTRMKISRSASSTRETSALSRERPSKTSATTSAAQKKVT
jgi:hypothetical protein